MATGNKDLGDGLNIVKATAKHQEAGGIAATSVALIVAASPNHKLDSVGAAQKRDDH